jgi:hypothetical protein
MHTLTDDDLTEVVDAKIPRVDLVSKAANGLSFIFMKSDSTPNLLPADAVRELLKQAQEGDEMTDSVIKADEEVLEAPTATAEGDVNEPGSPAWEAVDAATAWEQLNVLTGVKRALDLLSQREAEEVFAGAEACDDNSWDLQTACELVDQAIDLIAPYAVGEQSESEQPVAKSAEDARAVLTAFVKAGRALSASNESALRGAAAAIQNVLASLPSVAEPVMKAKGDPQVLVYDASGRVLGSVDQANLTTFAPEAPAEEETPADEAAEPADVASDEGAEDLTSGTEDAPATPDDAEPTPEAAPVAAPVVAPVAADEAVIPGTNTVQAPVVQDPENVKKALHAEFTLALTEALTPFAKQAADSAGLADLVKSLQERVEHLSKMPDDRKSPLLNGGTGTAGMAARDASTDEFADLRKAVDDAPPAKKVEAQAALTFAELRSRFV